MEDGLQLWLVALRNAPDSHQQLIELFPVLIAVNKRSTGTSALFPRDLRMMD